MPTVSVLIMCCLTIISFSRFSSSFEAFGNLQNIVYLISLEASHTLIRLPNKSSLASILNCCLKHQLYLISWAITVTEAPKDLLSVAQTVH